MRIYGVDFTSAPRARKPVTVAACTAAGRHLAVDALEEFPDFAAFERLLARPGPWIGGFDFPFGLPREAVTGLGWPQEWSALVAHCSALGRAAFKRALDAYRESRPAGRRYATRRGDAASGAHPSVKLVNPPVALMFLEGAPRLAAAGLHVPGLRPAQDSRVALEAYPGLLVRRQLGTAGSYKSDAGLATADRRRRRAAILAAFTEGRPLGIRVRLAPEQRRILLGDASGDRLDALVCAVQAHWGWLRRAANYGLPAALDPLEGWIVTASAA